MHSEATRLKKLLSTQSLLIPDTGTWESKILFSIPVGILNDYFYVEKITLLIIFTFVVVVLKFLFF
jgi:hypothetical protein